MRGSRQILRDQQDQGERLYVNRENYELDQQSMQERVKDCKAKLSGLEKLSGLSETLKSQQESYREIE